VFFPVQPCRQPQDRREPNNGHHSPHGESQPKRAEVIEKNVDADG
jgi:hypothetical protein